MRRSTLFVFAFLVCLAFVGAGCATEEKAAPATSNGGGSSATTSACGSAPLSWQDASTHVGARATVKGAVVDANYASSSNGKPTFLNVGKPYPDPARFTVLIWGENRDSFPKAPEVAYKGKTICVTGLIATYQGSPQMVVDSPSQITVAD